MRPYFGFPSFHFGQTAGEVGGGPESAVEDGVPHHSGRPLVLGLQRGRAWFFAYLHQKPWWVCVTGGRTWRSAIFWVSELPNRLILCGTIQTLLYRSMLAYPTQVCCHNFMRSHCLLYMTPFFVILSFLKVT